MKKLKESKVLRIIGKVVKAFLAIIIILIVSVIFIQRISDNKVTLGGYSIFTIISQSMAPEYEVGDMVVAKKADIDDIQIGSDVVYLGSEGDFTNKIVTHRVISKSLKDGEYYIQTKGIANEIPDPEITVSQIYGVVIHKGVLISFISKIINNMYGFYFLLFIPLAILITAEVIDIINERREAS